MPWLVTTDAPSLAPVLGIGTCGFTVQHGVCGSVLLLQWHRDASSLPHVRPHTGQKYLGSESVLMARREPFLRASCDIHMALKVGGAITTSLVGGRGAGELTQVDCGGTKRKGHRKVGMPWNGART